MTTEATPLSSVDSTPQAPGGATPPDSPAPVQASQVMRWRLIAIVASAVTALALVAMVLFARVPVGAGWRTGRHLPVREIWWLFTHELAVVAGGWLSPVVVTILVVAILVGCAALVGLAIVVPDDPVEPGAR